MDTNTYIKIITDTLIKKSKILDRLIEITKEQEIILNSYELNIENFDETMNKKEKLIEQLNQLDDGFEMIYSRVQYEIKNNLLEYKSDIIVMQDFIKKIMKQSTNLQIQEKSNKLQLETYLTNRKQEIKNYKMSSQTVSNYYKNMMNEYQGESYFLDKKK